MKFSTELNISGAFAVTVPLFVNTFNAVKFVLLFAFEALRYKPEGCGLHSQWGNWNFSLTKCFRPHYGPGVDSASNRNEYQGYLLGVKTANA